MTPIDGPVLETRRLVLRPPAEADFAPLCAVMADEETARHIGGVQEPAMVWRALASVAGHWMFRGYGFFSVTEKASGRWVGRVGPWFPHGWPQPEVGWTMAREYWGKGYAAEAAAACLDHVFDDLGWESVVHLIHAENGASKAVARKLGSVDTGRDWEIPGFDIVTDVWGQTAAHWRARRRRQNQPAAFSGP